MIKNNMTDIHYGIMCYLTKVGESYSFSEIKKIFSLSDNDFFTHIDYLMNNDYVRYIGYLMTVTEKGKKVLKETNNEDMIEMREI